MRNKGTLLGDGVSRAFLRALVQLIGGYRDALKFHKGERIIFNKDAFIESRSANMQPFLRKMLELQIFQQVIYILCFIIIYFVKYINKYEIIVKLNIYYLKNKFLFFC